MTFQSETDLFILPDIKSEDLIAFQNRIKTEPTDEDVIFLKEETILGPCDAELASVVTNSFHPDTEQSTIIDPELETINKQLIFEDHGSSYPQDPLDIQQQVISIKVEPSESEATAEGGSSIYDHNSHYNRIFTPNAVQSCLHCKKTFNCLQDLGKHHLIHEKVQMDKCCQCDKIFIELSDLENHMKMHRVGKTKKLHSKQLKESCVLPLASEMIDNCAEYEEYESHLNKNISLHTEEKVHKCNQCGTAFSKKYNLSRHLMVHSGEKLNECNLCGKSFTDKSNLNKHVMTHIGEKLHQCSYCGKTFFHRYDLNRHLMIHSGEKPYKCDNCGKAFIEQFSLNKHLLIHSGEKTHKCDNCGKSFREQSSLNKHLLIHSGVKPHKCHCGKAFYQKGNLNAHLVLHLEEQSRWKHVDRNVL